MITTGGLSWRHQKASKLSRQWGANHNIKFYMDRSHLRIAGILFFLICALSSYMIYSGEATAVAAWWLVIVMLFPIVILSMSCDSIVLRMFISVAFLTQFVSMPLFMANRELYTYYGGRAVKGFTFTIHEILSIYFLIAIFLILVVGFSKIFITLLPTSKIYINRNYKGNQYYLPPQQNRHNRSMYLILMIIVILAILPLNLWMFSNGVSLLGVRPPVLPFRLSGILHYLTKYIVPMTLAIIYSRTSRSYAPACILAAYAFVLGASQISRFSMIIMLFPVLLFAYMDRRKIIFGLNGIIALASFHIISLLRNVVYVITQGISGADSSEGLFAKILYVFKYQTENYSILSFFPDILHRVDGVQYIVLGYQFNPEAVGGTIAAIQRFLYQGWVPLDINAYHVAFLGTTLPEGFASVGGFLSTVLMMTNSKVHIIFLVSIMVAAFVAIGEGIARNMSRKFFSRPIYFIIGFIFTILFYTSMGTVPFWGMFAVLVVLCVTPRVKFKMNNSKSENKNHFVLNRTRRGQ